MHVKNRMLILALVSTCFFLLLFFHLGMIFWWTQIIGSIISIFSPFFFVNRLNYYLHIVHSIGPASLFQNIWRACSLNHSLPLLHTKLLWKIMQGRLTSLTLTCKSLAWEFLDYFTQLENKMDFSVSKRDSGLIFLNNNTITSRN